MAIKHKRIVNRKKRAQAMVDRLKDELELERCEVLLTQADAKRFEKRLRRNEILFYLESAGTSVFIPINKKLFFSPDLSEGDEEYFFQLIDRMWLHHLNEVASELLKQRVRLEALL